MGRQDRLRRALNARPCFCRYVRIWRPRCDEIQLSDELRRSIVLNLILCGTTCSIADFLMSIGIEPIAFRRGQARKVVPLYDLTL